MTSRIIEPAEFAGLSRWRLVIVTGPQRSGTTIAARMIASDSSMAYIDEEAYAIHDERRFQSACDLVGVVVHAPAMMHVVHRVADNDVFVVVMQRDTDAIVASQERIEWTSRWEANELAKYGAEKGPVAVVKYRRWEIQQAVVPHWSYLPYESLSAHPMWLPQSKRRQFANRQFREG